VDPGLCFGTPGRSGPGRSTGVKAKGRRHILNLGTASCRHPRRELPGVFEAGKTVNELTRPLVERLRQVYVRFTSFTGAMAAAIET